MRWITLEEVKNFINQNCYDIRVSHNGRWIDQKCTADVITIIADCILYYIKQSNKETFSSIDVWHSQYTKDNVESIFKKPNIDNDKAKNEYDKFFQQPMEMLANARVLNKVKNKNKNHYSVVNVDILQFLALREKNSLDFLALYNEKVLRDSGIWGYFETFFRHQNVTSFDEMKENYENFIISQTPINGVVECRRIFTKVLNPLAFYKNSYGTERGRLSKHKITFDMLMYNRDNFRDIFSCKPKDMTRKEFEKTMIDKVNPNLSNYLVQKAKRLVKLYNDTFFESKSEIRDDIHINDIATHMHHIFPEAYFPQIASYVENLIALTPTQHLNYAHPNGNTRSIDRQFQHLCLLAKTDTIKMAYEKIDDNIYDFDKLCSVLSTGLNDEKYNEISFLDFDRVVNMINCSYQMA